MQRQRRVLVPIINQKVCEHAIELACRVGHDECAELVLVHVVVVPYALSLDAPLPKQDGEAQEEFQIGRRVAERYGCPTSVRVIHQRTPAEAILQVAKEEKVDAIVLGVGRKEHAPGELVEMIKELLRRAECEVIIDRVAVAA